MCFLYKKAGHFPDDLARFCMWDPTAIPSGLLLLELCEREHKTSSCFSKSMLRLVSVKPGSLTVSGKVPSDLSMGRISCFSRSVSCPPPHSPLPVSVMSLVQSSVQVWFLNGSLLQCQLELHFLLCEMHFS